MAWTVFDYVSHVMACVSRKAAGVDCILRLTLAGGRVLLARIVASTIGLECLLCGNREWSLRLQSPSPAFSRGVAREFE